MPAKPIIGFIGLGIMGKPMAQHLLRAGYTLVVNDCHRVVLEGLLSAQCTEGVTPASVAAQCDVIITMLPDSPDVEQVALGENGLLEGAPAGKIYIDMSTIAPSVAVKVAERMAEKGVHCLDAPVSGGEVGAKNAALSIMVGGEEAVLEQVLPILETLGKTITLCGPNGAGQVVKACNQIQVALNIAGMAEAMVLGAKAGVDPAIILKVLSGGYAQNRVMDVRGPRLIQGDFEPGFKSRFHYKDLNIILKTGNDYGVPLPVSGIVHQLFSAMLAAGRGDLDHSGLVTVLEDLAKVSVRTQTQ